MTATLYTPKPWTQPSEERKALILKQMETTHVVEVTLYRADMPAMIARDQDGSHFGTIPNWEASITLGDFAPGLMKSFIAKEFPAEYAEAVGAMAVGWVVQTPLVSDAA